MIGPLLAGLLGLAGLAVAWRPGRQRWWHIALPLGGVLPVMAEPMLPARDVVLQLLDTPAAQRPELAEAAYVASASAEAKGLVVVAVACLLFAMVQGLKNSEDPEERIARAVSACLALVSNAVLAMIVLRDLWLANASGTDPLYISLLALLGALGISAGVLVVRQVTERPDHFAIQLVAGIMLSCTMLLLRVPTHFVQERLLQHTVGGQVLAVERRYQDKLPTLEGLELAPLSQPDSFTGDDWGWYSTSLGDPVEMPPPPGPVQVALSTEQQASLLVQADWGEEERTLQLFIQKARADEAHPFQAAERYGLISFLWMPRVEPTWSPDYAILPAEGGLQELVQACVEARTQRADDPCRIARVGASPAPLAPPPRR